VRTPLDGRTVTAAAIAVLVTVLPSGCGVSHSPLEVALGDAASATASASLAVRSLDDGDVTSNVASTAIDDAVTEISKASSDAATYRGSAGPERRLQERALPVLVRAVRHLHQTQDQLAKPAARPHLVKTLSRDRDHLEKLSTRAGVVG
jgi:hypothetical protein